MSESPQNVSGQPAGQPAQPSTTEGAHGTPAVGLTLQDVQQAIRTALAENDREQQSQRDKLENRVKQEVQRTVANLKAAGMEPTADQLATLETQTRKTIQDEAKGSTTTAPAQTQGQGNPEANPLMSLAGEIMEEYGVTLEESDPESEELKTFKGTPRQWLKAVEKAVKTKKDRISPPPAEPGARLPTIGGGSTPGNPIAGVTDTTQLWALARQQK